MPHSKYPSRISQNQSDNFSTNSKLRNRNVHLTRRQVCALWLHILRYVTLCCQGSPDNGWSFMSSPVWVWKVCVCVFFFSALIGWVIGWCICLIDWWVCWWIDWLVSCLVVWLLGEFDWLIESFSFMDFFFRVNSLIDWFLFYFLVGWLFTTLWMIPWNSMCSKSLQGAFRSLKHTQKDGIKCTSSLQEIPLFYLQSTRNVSPYSTKWNNISKWIFN